MREQHRNEQQDVLGPLVNTNRLQNRTQGVALIDELASNPYIPETKSSSQADSRVSQHGYAGIGQQRHIGIGVANIVERAKLALETIELFVAGKIGVAVRSQYSIENAKMGRDPLRQAPVRAGSQKNLPALAPPGGVEGRAAGDLKLQPGTPSGEPKRYPPNLERLPTGKLTEAVQQCI